MTSVPPPHTDSTVAVGRVVGLWRYPVKSMGSQTLSHAQISEAGIVGDRAFGVVDAATGYLLSAKRVPQLLTASALFRDDGEVDILLPAQAGAGGEGLSQSISSEDADVDAQLSAWLGRAVHLVRPEAGSRATVEIETDLDNPSVVFRFPTPDGSFFDSASALLVLTTASLRSAAALHPGGNWAVSRFRPNVLVDTPDGMQGWAEDAWATATMAFGGVQVAGRKVCERCIITTRPQPATGAGPALPADKEILRTLAAFHDSCLGVYFNVSGAGSVLVGDDVLRHEPA